MTDYIKRAEALPPEERTLDFPAKYTEIRALYHFCVDLGIKCTIEHLWENVNAEAALMLYEKIKRHPILWRLFFML